MQTLTQIKAMLEQAGLAPQKRFGQNFLIDQNLLGKLLELADVKPAQAVLEVGPGTGVLTESLLQRGARVVAVEIDSGLFRLLQSRLADKPDITLIHSDILSGKHAIEPKVLATLGPSATLISNLPYNIATPLVAQCLIDSWKVQQRSAPGLTKFESLSFTVQREVADRFAATEDTDAYGPISVLVGLLGRTKIGPMAPGEAFWPRPKILSRMMRIDFDAQAAARIADIDVLHSLISAAFAQRRKQIGSLIRRKDSPFAPAAMEAALAGASVPETVRAEQLAPQKFADLANRLAIMTNEQ